MRCTLLMRRSTPSPKIWQPGGGHAWRGPGWPHSHGAALLGTMLAALPVLNQGPTRHPSWAALVGAGHQLERS